MSLAAAVGWLWFAGADLRSDGSHRVRVEAGARRGHVALTVVLDPSLVVPGRGSDVDALVEWLPGAGASLFAGTRLTQIALDRGVEYQHLAIAGAAAELPRLGALHLRAGAELEVDVVRHGRGMETSVISFHEQRDYRDLFSLDLFLRVEIGAPP